LATLIGRFNADQPRDRWLTRDLYSYVVVGFDERLLLVATRPGRDGAVALIHRGARLGSHLAPHTKPTIKLARAVLQAGPKYASVEASISALGPLTPERVAAAFPDQVTEIRTDWVRRAVFRRQPRQVRIHYRHPTYGETEVWLVPEAPLEEARRVLSVIFGDRFSEVSTARGFADAALDLLPGFTTYQ
jgi:hypothetical protein